MGSHHNTATITPLLLLPPSSPFGPKSKRYVSRWQFSFFFLSNF